jgi:peroxiredoxin
MIGQGDRVPSLKVALSDGSSLDLSAPGGPLVLYFYPKDCNGSESLAGRAAEK